MYYFDPSFGYIYISTNGPVRYGLGPVVPHNPSTVTNQRYTHFGGWVEIQPHYVPDEWLEAFRNPHEAYQEKIKIRPIRWGWREWTLLGPIWAFIAFVAYTFLASILSNP